jgi:diguanylate cyclase (GGDEF)-like protein/PAS domain S-box-containing protein
MSLIVILDDRVTNRNIFAKLAASIEDGVDVRTFGDPLEALAWIENNTPDLVFSDFKMPHLDGADFVRRFRQIPGCADVPVVVLTVYEERSSRIRALEAGATDFLQSPVDHHEFLTRARNLLKLRKQQLIIKSRAHSLERELEKSEQSREEALRDSRDRLAQVIDTVPAMISAADNQGRCIFVNAHKATFFGADPTSAVGKSGAEVFGEEQDERNRGLDRLVFESGKALPSYEEEISDRSGETHVHLTTKSPLRDGSGRVTSVLTTSLDITDRKRAESHLLHLAHHDTLTDLPNRTLLRDRLRRQIARTRRGDRMFALHLLDLDRFKGVNDVLGHELGDQLLKAVALRLTSSLGDTEVVARLGGDEFAILQTDVKRAEDVGELASWVLEFLAEPFVIDGHQVTTGASIGIAMHPTDGGDADALLKNADLAMYRAKAEGRSTYRMFAADMNTIAREAVVLETDLRQALARREFELHYQPQIDIRTGEIVGAEALLRWRRGGGSLVPPAEFLPQAEENGLIVPINEWVMREACAQAKAWERAGLPPIRMAVNLSPVQFAKQDVAQHVIEVLEQTGLEPSRLELELTENIVIQNNKSTSNNLRRLQELGVTFSIDDFGTGYSSLAYVKNFPVNRLKIDQGFIRNLENDVNDAAIVRAIVNLGHSLNLDVIAEGVERAEQLEILRKEGCDEVQGYFFSRPLPARDFVKLFGRELPAMEAPYARTA